MHSFRSEWMKLSRRNTLLGFGGAMVGFAALITFIVVLSASGADISMGGDGGPGRLASTVDLAASDGAVFAITQAATFLGIITLALFAGNLAGEFSKGTIRMLFVTEPRRLRVLAGKLAALATFVAACIAMALGVSVGLAAIVAASQGIATAAWWTATGASAILSTYINLTGVALIYGLLGAMLAVITRSSAIAISFGAAYFMIVEPLVGSFWDTLGDWGPATMLSAFADGGTAAIGYSFAAILALAYGIASVAVTSTVLVRRDVTS